MNNSKNPTIRDIVLRLEAENRIDYDISHRGGTYWATAEWVVWSLFPTISELKHWDVVSKLPHKVGVWVNYLGGGLRGTINRSDYSKELLPKYAKRIDAFTRECKNRYLEIEDGEGLNNEEYPNGDTNWEALGTNRSRAAGIKSGY